MAKMLKEIKVVSVNDIIVNANQPRKTFNDETLTELANSIKAVGIIQPLTVKVMTEGY